MNASQFKEMMLRADTLQRVAQEPEGNDFWAGYMRGLRRLHHGESFGTDQEHELWFGISPDETDMQRRARGEGYRAGFAGVDPVELSLSLDEYLTTKELAEAAGVVDSRIRQVAASIPGGRKTEAGWRFPRSAVDFFKKQPAKLKQK